MFGKKAHSDQVIIDHIRQGGVQRSRYESIFYRQFAYFVSTRPAKYALSDEEARDAYTEAFMAVVDHIVSGRFKGDSSLKTYLSRIFRNKCVDRFRKNTTIKVEWVDEFPDLPDDSRDFLRQMVGVEMVQQVEHYIGKLGKGCQDLLRYSGRGYSPAEIAAELGFSSARSVSSQRYKCLGRLRKIMGR